MTFLGPLDATLESRVLSWLAEICILLPKQRRGRCTNHFGDCQSFCNAMNVQHPTDVARLYSTAVVEIKHLSCVCSRWASISRESVRLISQEFLNQAMLLHSRVPEHLLPRYLSILRNFAELDSLDVQKVLQGLPWSLSLASVRVEMIPVGQVPSDVDVYQEIRRRLASVHSPLYEMAKILFSNVEEADLEPWDYENQDHHVVRKNEAGTIRFCAELLHLARCPFEVAMRSEGSWQPYPKDPNCLRFVQNTARMERPKLILETNEQPRRSSDFPCIKHQSDTDAFQVLDFEKAAARAGVDITLVESWFHLECTDSTISSRLQGSRISKRTSNTCRGVHFSMRLGFQINEMQCRSFLCLDFGVNPLHSRTESTQECAEDDEHDEDEEENGNEDDEENHDRSRNSDDMGSDRGEQCSDLDDELQGAQQDVEPVEGAQPQDFQRNVQFQHHESSQVQAIMERDAQNVGEEAEHVKEDEEQHINKEDEGTHEGSNKEDDMESGWRELGSDQDSELEEAPQDVESDEGSQVQVSQRIAQFQQHESNQPRVALERDARIVGEETHVIQIVSHGHESAASISPHEASNIQTLMWTSGVEGLLADCVDADRLKSTCRDGKNMSPPRTSDDTTSKIAESSRFDPGLLYSSACQQIERHWQHAGTRILSSIQTAPPTLPTKQCLLMSSKLLSAAGSVVEAASISPGDRLYSIYGDDHTLQFGVVAVNRITALPARDRDVSVIRVHRSIDQDVADAQFMVTADHSVVAGVAGDSLWRHINAAELDATRHRVMGLRQRPSGNDIFDLNLASVETSVYSEEVLEVELEDPYQAVFLAVCCTSVASNLLIAIFGCPPRPDMCGVLHANGFFEVLEVNHSTDGKCSSDPLANRSRPGMYRNPRKVFRIRPPHNDTCKAWCKYYMRNGTCSKGVLCDWCHHPEHKWFARRKRRRSNSQA